MDAESVFISAFIFGYVAEMALRWIWRRWFGSGRQAGKKALGK
jgi:hypothetical protein